MSGATSGVLLVHRSLDHRGHHTATQKFCSRAHLGPLQCGCCGKLQPPPLAAGLLRLLHLRCTPSSHQTAKSSSPLVHPSRCRCCHPPAPLHPPSLAAGHHTPLPAAPCSQKPPGHQPPARLLSAPAACRSSHQSRGYRDSPPGPQEPPRAGPQRALKAGREAALHPDVAGRRRRVPQAGPGPPARRARCA